MELALLELEAPLKRIASTTDRALRELSTLGRGALWQQALRAVVAINQAPRHLLRPQLVLVGHLAAGGAGQGTNVETFAAGVELLHLFMLVHDDVMDHATLRRGQPALRVVMARADPELPWLKIRDLAIVLGDVIYARSMELLLEGAQQASAAFRTILTGAQRAGAGQFQDVLGWRGLEQREEAASFRQAMIDKGAHHSFSAPLAAGMLLADAGAEVAAAMQWGIHAGVAFQALDDVRDLVSKAVDMGKDSLQDFREGRLSLPLFLLRQAVSPEQWEVLRALRGHGVLSMEDRMELFRLAREHRLGERCSKQIAAELAAAEGLTDAVTGRTRAREALANVLCGLRALLDHVTAGREAWDIP
ncbi:MAG: polyprenyl synthetase family protein [Candidatus Schekmanbacteria bacterium]|nr:polyprenyl synthetase family protein [Candidatus Schekmanbacteria bacterium]